MEVGHEQNLNKEGVAASATSHALGAGLQTLWKGND